MPAGTPKVNLFGGKSIVPGGSQTFNASGTFTVPAGVTKVNMTGRGTAGNPGNCGNPGGSGGGGTGGCGGARLFFTWCQTPCPGWGYYVGPPPTGCGWTYGTGGAGGGYGYPGNPGNPGNPGIASTGLSRTFPGSNFVGNGGAGGSVGWRGSPGNPGGSIVQYGCRPGCFGPPPPNTYCGNAGSGGSGANGNPLAPCCIRNCPSYHQYGAPGWPNGNGTGGGGAGLTNSGSSSPISNGGNGGTPGGGKGGYRGPPYTPSGNPLRLGQAGQVTGAGGGGGGGWGGGGGGGRGPCDPQGSGGGGANGGAPANNTSYNCVPVSPGTPYPIFIGSPSFGPPEGQITISWNPQ